MQYSAWNHLPLLWGALGSTHIKFAKKIADKTYEVHLTAIIENGWHTFSQTQPKEAIALPTKISFNENPLVQLNKPQRSNLADKTNPY